MPPHGLKKEMKLPDAAERAAEWASWSRSRSWSTVRIVDSGGCCCLLLLLLLVVAGMGSQQVTKKFVAEAARKPKRRNTFIKRMKKSKVSWRIFKWFKRVLSYFSSVSWQAHPPPYFPPLSPSSGCHKWAGWCWLWLTVCVYNVHKLGARHFKCLLKQ